MKELGMNAVVAVLEKWDDAFPKGGRHSRFEGVN